MLKSAFGSISMLLALLIVGLLFVATIPLVKSITNSSLDKSSIQQQNIEQKADEMVKDIEKMRQQSIEYYNNQQDSDY